MCAFVTSFWKGSTTPAARRPRRRASPRGRSPRGRSPGDGRRGREVAGGRGVATMGCSTAASSAARSSAAVGWRRREPPRRRPARGARAWPQATRRWGARRRCRRTATTARRARLLRARVPHAGARCYRAASPRARWRRGAAGRVQPLVTELARGLIAHSKACASNCSRPRNRRADVTRRRRRGRDGVSGSTTLRGCYSRAIRRAACAGRCAHKIAVCGYGQRFRRLISDVGTVLLVSRHVALNASAVARQVASADTSTLDDRINKRAKTKIGDRSASIRRALET